MPVEKALAEIEQEADRQFDPDLAVLFVDNVRNGQIKPILNYVEPTVAASKK